MPFFRFTIFAGLAALLLANPAPVSAANNPTLLPSHTNCSHISTTCGPSVPGVLTTSSCPVTFGTSNRYGQIYTFAGKAGDTVTITMSSFDLDSLLFLYFQPNAGDPPVATDDDSGENLDAKIVHTLGGTGTWEILVTSTGSTGSAITGSYDLTLSCPGSASPANAYVLDAAGDFSTGLNHKAHKFDTGTYEQTIRYVSPTRLRDLKVGDAGSRLYLVRLNAEGLTTRTTFLDIITPATDALEPYQIDGFRAEAVAVDESRNRLFIAETGRLGVIDLSDLAPVGVTQFIGTPIEMEASSANGSVYLSLVDNGLPGQGIEVFIPPSYSTTQKIPGLFGKMIIDHSGRFLYVIEHAPIRPQIKVIDTATNGVVASMDAGDAPTALTLSDDDRYLFVATRIGDPSAFTHIVRIYDNENRTLKTQHTFLGPYDDIAVTADSAWLWGVRNDDGLLEVIRLADKQVVYTNRDINPFKVMIVPLPRVCALACKALVPSEVTAGNRVEFASTASTQNCNGAPTYLWTFGDNTTSTLASPSKVYDFSGIFDWSLTVTVDGQSCTSDGAIRVDTPFCVSTNCRAAVPATGRVGQTLDFEAYVSTPDCPVVPAYSWTFGDDTSSTDVKATKSYTLPGVYAWQLVVTLDGVEKCRINGSITIACQVIPSAVPVVRSGETYTVSWAPNISTAGYEFQEALDPSFIGATLVTTNASSMSFTHTVTTATSYFYRVRPFSDCSGDNGVFSLAVRVDVIPPAPPTDASFTLVVPFGSSTAVQQTALISGPAGATFTARSDQSWLAVEPQSGTMTAAGVTLTLTASPGSLPVGTSSATILVATTMGTSVTTTSIPVSIASVTPVSPVDRTGPLPDTLIIPAVASIEVPSVVFLSDVRLTNLLVQPRQFFLTYTPKGTDGKTSSVGTTVTIQPGATAAFNDILKYFLNVTTGVREGSLEIRPLGAAATTDAAVGTSRTYARRSDGGTYGQYIPASRFGTFIAKASGPPAVLSLQQIQQSDPPPPGAPGTVPTFRTNLGLVEGSGKPADVRIRIFSGEGVQLDDNMVSLLPNEQRQLNQYIKTRGIDSLSDGRIEVEVVSDTGFVTAYASVLDNRTDDPTFEPGVQPSLISSSTYIVPGVADYPGLGFYSDLRIYNPSVDDVTVTLAFYPEGSSVPVKTVVRSIVAGHVDANSNAVNALFGLTDVKGTIHVIAPFKASLVVTARTYKRTGDQTYGQFIPAVTPGMGTAVGERPLQLLQIEQSDRFRSNVGIVELTGNPVRVEIAAIIPGTTRSPTFEYDLGANTYLQFDKLLLNYPELSGNIYNARVTVQVISGAGRVAAYASVLDNLTNDPTYIPGQ